MNQENSLNLRNSKPQHNPKGYVEYKEIARIIKESFNPIVNYPSVFIGEELADYFEKEDCKAKVKKGLVISELRKFNREQFLKGAGVK